MKYYCILKKAGLLLIAVTTFMSCQKEQSLVNKIEGIYKIEKMVYNVNNRDSVVSNPNSTLFFEDCTLKKQPGAQQCDGYIEIEGQNRVSFGYRPEKVGSKISMFFNIGDPDDFKHYGGYYITEDHTDNSLILARHTYDQYQNKIYNLRIFLKK